MVEALAPFMPRGMARYAEDWSPRAFGDNLTAWGTPVVLIESGGLPPGRGFTEFTRLNFVAILRVLEELVRDDLAAYDPQIYDQLARNTDNAWVDVAVRGGTLWQPLAASYRADLAFNVLRDEREAAGCAGDDPVRSRVFEIGDCRFLAAGRELDAEGSLLLVPFVAGVRGWSARRWLGRSPPTAIHAEVRPLRTTATSSAWTTAAAACPCHPPKWLGGWVPAYSTSRRRCYNFDLFSSGQVGLGTCHCPARQVVQVPWATFPRNVSRYPQTPTRSRPTSNSSPFQGPSR